MAKVEVGGPRIQSHSWHSEFKASLVDMRYCLREKGKGWEGRKGEKKKKKKKGAGCLGTSF